MNQAAFDRIAVVLYEPQNDLNIGAVVRAAKNFGIADIRLVRPADGRPETIRVMATHADDLVERLAYFDDLDEALADCHHVVASTARERASSHIVANPRGLAASIVEWTDREEKVALMFGREDHGLPNEALDRCNAVVTIPTSPHHTSLNLAQAVLLVLWEVFRALEEVEAVSASAAEVTSEHPPASREMIERMLAQAKKSLHRIEFFKYGDGEHVMRSLRAVFGRARIDERELAIWFGIFSDIEGYLDRMGIRTDD